MRPEQSEAVAHELAGRYGNDRWRRDAVLLALGRVGRADDEVMSVFVGASRDSDPEVRCKCANGVSRLKPVRPEALAVLTAMLSDRESSVVLVAADAIRVCGSPNDRLVDQLLDAGERVGGGAGGLCFAAAARLAPDVGRIAGRVRGHPDWVARAEAVVGLSERPDLDEASLTLLRELATDGKDRVALNACALLLRSPHPADVDTAVGGLSAIVDRDDTPLSFEPGPSSSLLDVLLTVRQLGNGMPGARAFAAKFANHTDERVQASAKKILESADKALPR